MAASAAQTGEMNQAELNVLTTMMPELPELLANLERAGLRAEFPAYTIAEEFLPADQLVIFKETIKPIIRAIWTRHQEAIAAENAARAAAPLMRTYASVVYPNESMERQLALLEQDPIIERRDRRVAEVRAALEEYNRGVAENRAAYARGHLLG